jgi:hypothetical protein
LVKIGPNAIDLVAACVKPYKLVKRTSRTMDPRRQRISAIKDSLQDMTLEELQNMSDDLTNLIQVLVTRQVAIEDVILERLEEAFSK